MDVTLASPRRPTGDLIVAGRFTKTRFEPMLEAEAGDSLAEAAKRCNGKKGTWAEATLGRRTLRLEGLGSVADFDRRGLSTWLANVMATARARHCKRLALVLPQHSCVEGAGAVAEVVATIESASYRFDTFRDAGDDRGGPEAVSLVVHEELRDLYRAELPAAGTIARAVSWARDLGNTPPNVATPEWMAKQAQEMARERSIRVTTLGTAQLLKKKMEAIVAVGGGSENGPRMVRMRYGRVGPKVVLVGKGVTFDSGGISIKPAASMDEMKYDKCGACAVLGIVRAVADLELPIRLSAIIALAENMPGGSAYRPGDIVRCYDGTTVEIGNTDAEGRMILADALGWAREEEPDFLVDYATLTGACVVALGEGAAGLFSADDALADALLAAARESGERLWRLPLWPEFRDHMKGTHADLRNSGGRWGGACTAAAFLSHFAGEEAPWAHVDLAGPAYSATKPVNKGMAGATGYGVALSTGWLRSVAARNPPAE